MGPTVIVHGRENPVSAAHLNDAEIASGVFMLCSINPACVTALPQIARDRILYLSQRAERLEEFLRRVLPAAEAEMGELSQINEFLAQPKTSPSAEPDVMKRL